MLSDIGVDECASATAQQQCQNGGSCVDIDQSTLNTTTCNCPLPYTGPTCNICE